MKHMVPGAEGAVGVKPVDFTLPKGDYVFEIIKASVDESANSPCLIHKFEMVVVDGPDTDNGKTTQGRKYTRRIVELLPEHQSYDKDNTRAGEEIADLCAAAGVEYDEGYEDEEFGGQKVQAKLGVRTGKDADGNPQPENTVQTQKDDDGVLHMWLPDDGKTKTSKKPASKASAPSRRR